MSFKKMTDMLYESVKLLCGKDSQVRGRHAGRKDLPCSTAKGPCL